MPSAATPSPTARGISVPRTEFVLLGLLATLWGSSYLFIKIAVAAIPPVTLIALRVTLAAMFLLAVMRIRGEKLPSDGATWRVLFLQSTLNSSIAWVVLAWGAQHIPSGIAGVLNSTSPLFVFLMSMFASRVSAWRACGVLLGLAGVVLVVGIDASDIVGGSGLALAAKVAVLCGAFLYAVAAMHGKKLAHVSPLATATGTLLCAAACLMPASLVLDRPWTLRPDATQSAAVLALALLCTAVALMLYFRLLQTLGSMGVASQSYLRSGVSVLLGLLVLGETPGPTVLAGLALIILGVAQINLKAPAFWRLT